MAIIETVQDELLAASRVVVPSTRVCIYRVGDDLAPYGHRNGSGDTSWLHQYARYRDLDPFHPRYFAQAQNSVFRTCDAAGSDGQRNSYIAGFRRPMGVAYKLEVFLRDRKGEIRGGIRLARPVEMGEFSDHELAAVRAMQPVLSRAWVSMIAQSQTDTLLSSLTLRESDVLECVLNGAANKQIAARLGLALPTVKSHMQNIFRKLGVTNRSGLIARFKAPLP